MSRRPTKKTTRSRKSPRRAAAKRPRRSIDGPYSSRAHQYARDVVVGKVVACKWVRLACRRHLDDLERTGFAYVYRPEKAELACKFIENLPHTKGKWANDAEKLHQEAWQLFIVCSLFGWVRKDNGNYRFREGYIAVPRKNAKSTEAAGIGLFKFVADGEFGAEVYSGATTEKQAWEVFRPARLMAANTPPLRKAFGVEVNAKNLAILANGSRFEPVIGKPGDGASPSCAIVDEYHEHLDDTLYDTMKTGMGARENPLLLVITTAGSDRSGPCYALQQDVQKVLEGKVLNDRLFGIIYTIDEGDDWKSELALKKANPNFDVSVSGDFLRDAQRDAINSARKQNVFKTKHLNIWVNADVAWMNMARWDSLAEPNLRIEEFVKQECVAAFDLASRVDLASKVLVFWRDREVPEELFIRSVERGHCSTWNCECGADDAPLIDLWIRGASTRGFCERCRDLIVQRGERHFYVFGAHYLNEQRVEDAASLHYAGWANDGRLTVTPGNVTDYGWIADDLVRDASRFVLREAAHDPYHAAPLVQFIQARPDWNQSVQFLEFPQRVEKMSPAMKELEAVVLDGRLHHDGDPILGWCVSNVVCHRDRKGNIFPTKQREENKIDAAVALMMALARVPAQSETVSVSVEVW